jgi:hypothetical protein
MKNYKLSPAEIWPMVPNIGFAFATDRISIEGCAVDYMVREKPSREGDTGWIFYGGGETQEYIDDPTKTSVLSVNTIANYDPEIIEFLTYPTGTEIARNATGKLEVINPNAIKPDVIFFYPIIEGRNSLTKHWSIEATSRMFRRFDHGNLVIWKPGLTIWITSYGANEISLETRIKAIQETISEKAEALEHAQVGSLHKIRYWLEEDDAGASQRACYITGLTKSEQIQLAVYFDGAEHVEEIEKIWSSLTCRADT